MSPHRTHRLAERVTAHERDGLVLLERLVAHGAAQRVLDEVKDLCELLVAVQQVRLGDWVLLHLVAKRSELGLFELERRVLLLEERDLAFERVKEAFLEAEDVLELADAIDGGLAGLGQPPGGSGQRRDLCDGHRPVGTPPEHQHGSAAAEREEKGLERTPTAMRWPCSSSALRCSRKEGSVSVLLRDMLCST